MLHMRIDLQKSSFIKCIISCAYVFSHCLEYLRQPNKDKEQSTQ
jgi:hypothetical protein